MKTYEIQSPDGRVFEVTVPDSVTQWEVLARLKYGVQQGPDPTEGMTGGEKFLAGTGKAFADLGRGAGQRVGAVSQEEADAARALDAPLMQTGAGVAGNIAGNLAAAIPAAFVPGANTVAGGAATGAALGALQPTATGESAIQNTLIGGALGGAVPFGMGLYREAKAVAQPIANHNAVIGGALLRAVGEPNANSVVTALRSAPGARTPGVALSSGERVSSEGLSAVEDAIRTQLPGGSLATQSQGNRQVLASTLRGIAQDDTALEAAQQARKAASGPLYTAAGRSSATVDLSRTASLLDRVARANPGNTALQSAVAQIRASMTDEAGNLMTSPRHVISVVDGVQELLAGAKNTYTRDVLGTIKKSMMHQLSKVVPEQRAADKAFAAASRPINQMQTGQALANKLIPSTAGDMPARLNYASLATAMRNPNAVAKTATGFKRAQFDKVMDPAQAKTIRGVTDDASRIAESISRGTGIGSATARRIFTSGVVANHVAENAPTAMAVISLVQKVPFVGGAIKTAGSLGSMVATPVERQIIGKMDEMLATDPVGVARLIEQELTRLTASQRQAVTQALPQRVREALKALPKDTAARIPQAAAMSLVGNNQASNAP